MQAIVEVADRKHFRKADLEPLRIAGWIAPVTPNTPKSPRQRYRTTAAGEAVLTDLQGCTTSML
jgi:ATP-dependent DNA helicase RecG